MKTKRQNEIIRLITSGDIETQEELASELRSLGYKVTQATVSRDIRALKLTKVTGKDSERLTRILTDSLVNVDSSGNLIVVKTLSGSANVAAEALDNLGWPEILGTIAGDNTIFIVVRNETDTADISGRIRRLTDQR